MIARLKMNLEKAQNQMKHMADKHRSERQFAVGDWVYLKLHPYRQVVIHQILWSLHGSNKIGQVAYTLQLPQTTKIHPTFHVSLLKGHHGPPPLSMDQSIPRQEGLPDVMPPKIPDVVRSVRTIKRKNAPVVQWLIEWKHLPSEEATWEDASKIMQAYAFFDPWGKGSFRGGSLDTLTAMQIRRAQARTCRIAPRSDLSPAGSILHVHVHMNLICISFQY